MDNETINKTSDLWVGPQDSKQHLVSQILKIVSGDLPLNKAEEFIADDIKFIVSGRSFVGIRFWYLWLRAARNCCGCAKLTLSPITMKTKGDIVEITAEFLCERNEVTHRSTSLIFQHSVINGKVRLMSTKWQNYEFLFGWPVRSSFFLPVLFFKLWWCSKR